jgi:predicted secreted protein
LSKYAKFHLVATIILALFVMTVSVNANAAVGWSKTYGGTKAEGHSGATTSDTVYPTVIQTSDGGFLLTGDTSSFGAGSNDAYLVKTDANGVMQWQKTYGGPLNEIACGVCNTSDGGYALMAITNSFGAGSNDAWLIKIDANGNMQWNKTYGGTGDDVAWIVAQTADGGYAFVGYTGSSGAGGHDAWLVKTDRNGTMQWNKTYGTSSTEEAVNLILTSDGGYALVSFTTSFGGYKGELIKTDSSGNMQWDKTYGIGSYSWFDTGIQTANGGYVIVGVTYPTSKRNVWLITIDSSGNVLWSNSYGGADDDFGLCVLQMNDGGYLVASNTASVGAGGVDGWLFRTDASGNMLWDRTYGGAGTEFLSGLIRTSDGGYAMAGYTDSFGAGSTDLWLIKTDSTGVIPEFSGSMFFVTFVTLVGVSVAVFLRKLPRTKRFC